MPATIIHIAPLDGPIEGLKDTYVQITAENVFNVKEAVKSTILTMVSSFIRYHNYPFIQLPCLDSYLTDLRKGTIIPISESITLKLSFDEVM